jgi:BirA family biotin operon repressor/biotin-[acetyl-CoA-carboxylase] ligase
MNLNRLLSLLSDGEFHSGSELGRLVGVSRTSIWKAIPSLQELNVPVEVVKGKGYRVQGGLDLLDKNKILSMLPCNIKERVNLDILLSHSSTNDYLTSFKESAHQNYHICLAEHQTAGRGRRGKVWVSPFAKNISFSAGFLLGGGVEVLSGLSLVVGVAVAKTLESLGIKNVGLKWPNDVFVGDKKIAGILLELSGEATTNWNVICGIGLNVHMDKNDGVSIDQEWCSLTDSISIERNFVISKLLAQLVEVLELFKVEGFQSFMSEWARFDVLSGEKVVVTPNGVEGYVVGVNMQGALLIKSVNGEHVINAGEVSVRKQ